MIYLDYSANTPADPRVLDAFISAQQNFTANPNSDHPMGLKARDELSNVTDSIAALLGAKPEEIIYTSGASESNNLAIKGIMSQYALGSRISVSPLEHSSVTGAIDMLTHQGYGCDTAELNEDGTIDIGKLRTNLRQDTVLLCVALVDSELGTVQPIEKIAALKEDFPNLHIHVDATQAVGKIPLNIDSADTVSIAPHKFYGLNSSGLLIRRRGIELTPQISGGGSTTPYRSGTPDLAMAVASKKALELAISELPKRTEYVKKLNLRIRDALSKYPRVQINSPINAVPHILNLSVEGVRGTAFQRALGERGVCVSVRSACSTGGAPSKAVMALYGDRRRALSSWRISLSHLTTDDEIDKLLAAFDECYNTLAPLKSIV